ncbi:hypothetical protein [Cognaticolwellia mytili]|uniref:hypothetical protein n=1 Tax=Cognaticolwellia mytili TaxID=1888913 RepID=UPI000A175321|nr:hypothetical protein [Cognaticolwellia mytili]
MQFQISALKEGRFKKPVIIEVPSEKLNAAGQTIYNKAHFVAEFINVSKEEREAHQKATDELQEKLSALGESGTYEQHKEIQDQQQALIRGFIKKYFVSFEKHPKHPFPFLEGEAEIKPSSDTIDALLDIRLIRENVSDAYNDEINKNQDAKLNKLVGNLQK